MDGIAWAGSAMIAARSRLEIATDNLANASTDGFVPAHARGFLNASGAGVVAERANQHGALRHTGRDLDLAIVGDGGFRVRDARGRITVTRNGAFTRAPDGTLQDPAGRTLLGHSGPLHVLVSDRINESGRVLSSGRVVDRLALPAGSTVHAGFLETTGVNAIGEMIDVLAAERSFESAQKVVSAIDSTREKSSGDVARIK